MTPWTKRLRSLAFAVALPASAGALADEVTVECRVLYRVAGGVYVDAGKEAGIAQGAAGRLDRKGKGSLPVEVAETGNGSTYLRSTATTQDLPEAGETVVLIVEGAPPASAPSKDSSATLKDRSGEDEPFVPLLASPDLKSQAYKESKDVVHGRLSIQEMFQTGTDDHDFSITRFGSSGAWERIDGTPWAFEWSGDIAYRTGEGYEDTRYNEEIRLDLFRFSLYRRFDDMSFVRIGRFMPRELPSVGYLDGVHGEKVLDDRFRVGAMMGFKPTHDDLDPSFKELTWVLYGTAELGKMDELWYSGTLGLLTSLFEGTPDRLAFLFDQRATIGLLRLDWSSELDFDVGAGIEREGIRLTRLDFAARYPVAPILTLQAGVNHYETLDTEAERSVLREGTLNPEEFFQDSYWRYWVGASHDLFWKLRLSEEFAYIDSVAHDALRWQATLTRFGLPYCPNGSIWISVYNLGGIEAEGYGGKLAAQVPLLDHRLVLEPAIYYRFLESGTSGSTFFDETHDKFTVSQVVLRAYWTISSAWMLFAGASYTLTDEENAILIDMGVTFKW